MLRATVKNVGERRPGETHILAMRYDRKLNWFIWRLDGNIVAIHKEPGIPPSEDGFKTLYEVNGGSPGDLGPGGDFPIWFATAGMGSSGYPGGLHVGSIENADGTMTGIAPLGQDLQSPSNFLFTDEELDPYVQDILLGEDGKHKIKMEVFNWKISRGESPGHYEITVEDDDYGDDDDDD